MRRISFMLLFLAVSFAVSAQSKREVVRAKVDSVLMKNYNKSNFDTLYMKRPEGKLTLKLRGNLSGNYLKSRYTVSGEKVTAKLNTDTRATLSVAATYLGVTAGVAINPSRLSGRNKDVEFNVNAYGNRFGIEANYQLSRTLSGDINYGVGHDHIEKGYLRLAKTTSTSPIPQLSPSPTSRSVPQDHGWLASPTAGAASRPLTKCLVMSPPCVSM